MIRPLPPDPPLVCYAVVAIATGRVQYCGEKLWDAAVALWPGTCHAQGENALHATDAARRTAQAIRQGWNFNLTNN